MSDKDPESPERPRPRIVDKRISARGPNEAPVQPREQAPTPEQESDEARIARAIADAPGEEWIVNVSLTLGNVASVKLEAGKFDDAQLAIDALAAIVNDVGARLQEAETPLRQMLAQLQTAYAARKT